MIMDLQDLPSPEDSDWEMVDGVLHGVKLLEISHEWGELGVLTDHVYKM